MHILYQTLCTSLNEATTSSSFVCSIMKLIQNKDDNTIDQLFKGSSLFNMIDKISGKIYRIIMTNIPKHNVIENFLPGIIDSFQKKVLTFNNSVPPTSNDNPNNDNRPIVLNNNNLNRVFGWVLIKTQKKYCN